jgi:hypothetical protein
MNKEAKDQFRRKTYAIKRAKTAKQADGGL